MLTFQLIATALVSVAAVWLAVRWASGLRRARARRQVEDALKHLFEEQYRQRQASLQSLGGALRIPGKSVLALVGRMQRQGLLAMDGQTYALTDEGQRLALQVVRAHRLLERYFADEARLPLRDVHAAAERKEHALSLAEVDRLSAALGHPTLDPHGDPIPTREGSVAPPSGIPATAWSVGATGRVVHIEDEPEISFAQILASGLHVGQTLRVTEATPTRIVMTDGAGEYRLAPAVAANVFLAQASGELPAPVLRLSDLPNKIPARVVGLDEACQGFSRRRLMDLGFTDGATIRPFLRTFAGDPRAYEVRGTLIALRNDQASQVLVQPLPEEQHSAGGTA